MIRLHFVVEGQTEETFVNQMLVPHLGHFRVVGDARCVLTSRQGFRQFKGGVSKYVQISRDLLLWMKEDQNRDARFTTMFDLYRLPGDFPGRAKGQTVTDPYQRVNVLEQSMADDIQDRRLSPHIQLHEFEALLFTDIRRLLIEFPSAGGAVAELDASTQHFSSPELIDDGLETAPSKRIITAIPDYAGLKVTAGPRVASDIGFTAIREKCPHFDGWLRRLEQFGD
jgi:hypothetical protein